MTEGEKAARVDEISIILEKAKSLLMDEVHRRGVAVQYEAADVALQLARRIDAVKQDLGPLRQLDTNERSSLSVPSGASDNMSKGEEKLPSYRVVGDTLLRQGRGRDRRTRYTHTIHREDFAKVVSRLDSIRCSGKDFTALDVKKDLILPDYQVYVVLGLLRKLGVIASPKKGSYCFQSANGELKSDLIWANAASLNRERAILPSEGSQ